MDLSSKYRAESRRGGISLEIFGAFCLLIIMLVPVLGAFTTGVRQTHTVRSYTAARSIADLALSMARAELASGSAGEESGTDVTSDVLRLLQSTARQLNDLSVTRSIRSVGSSGRLYVVTVMVTWADRYVHDLRSVRLETCAVAGA